MTQVQYETIVKIIENGAPALAAELVTALSSVVNLAQQQAGEIKALTAKQGNINALGKATTKEVK